MRIGLDGRLFDTQIPSGGKRHLECLMANLSLLNKKHSFYLFSNRRIRGKYPDSFKQPLIKIPLSPVKTHMISWEQFLLPDALSKYKIDVYHSILLPIPCGVESRCKFVISFLDATAWMGVDKSTFSDEFISYLKKWIPPSLKKADKVIANSKSAKRDIIKMFSIPSSKIRVIYPEFINSFRVLSNKDNARKTIKHKLGINGPFILNCNVLSPRKNVETLIRAFKHLKAKRKIKHKLVIVGSNIYYKLSVKNPKDIIFTGSVSDRLLLYLYNLADLFVYPSIYEGFGYPPLEAMACGIPVISSNAPSLMEVVGKNGIVFKPLDYRRLSDLMLNVIEDRNLRAEMVKNGFARVRYFSQKRQAAQTLAVYEEVCKNS